MHLQQWSFFQNWINCFFDDLIPYIYSLIVEMNSFRADLSDASAKTATLICSCLTRWRRAAPSRPALCTPIKLHCLPARGSLSTLPRRPCSPPKPSTTRAKPWAKGSSLSWPTYPRHSAARTTWAMLMLTWASRLRARSLFRHVPVRTTSPRTCTTTNPQILAQTLASTLSYLQYTTLRSRHSHGCGVCAWKHQYFAARYSRRWRTCDCLSAVLWKQDGFPFSTSLENVSFLEALNFS